MNYNKGNLIMMLGINALCLCMVLLLGYFNFDN